MDAKEVLDVCQKLYEQKLYRLIARQYIAQFYPEHLYQSRKLAVTIEGGLFTANSRVSVQEGWKTLYPKKKANVEDKEGIQSLPDLKKGDALLCDNAEVLEKQTQPPKPFIDATLLAAMTGIARYVKDPEIRKILKDTDGLGTEATRAGIIELLFNRKYLRRQGKNIHGTETGKALISTLPESVSQPDMTARWEASLNDIVERKGSYATFIEPLKKTLSDLLVEAGRSGLKNLQNLPAEARPAYKKPGYKKRSYGKGRKRTTTSGPA